MAEAAPSEGGRRVGIAMESSSASYVFDWAMVNILKEGDEVFLLHCESDPVMVSAMAAPGIVSIPGEMSELAAKEKSQTTKAERAVKYFFLPIFFGGQKEEERGKREEKKKMRWPTTTTKKEKERKRGETFRFK